MIEQTLERIAAALEKIAAGSEPAKMSGADAPVKAPAKKPAAKKPAAKKPATGKPAPAEVEAVDYDGLVKIMQKLAEEKGRQHVVQLIGEVGASKMPEVAKMPEKFDELAAKARELLQS